MLVPDLEHIILILFDGFWFIFTIFGIVTLFTHHSVNAKYLFGIPMYCGGFMYVVCNMLIFSNKFTYSIISFSVFIVLFFALKFYFSRKKEMNE